MKRLELFSLFVTLFAIAAAKADHVPPTAMELPGIVFEDATLTDTTRAAITGDLARVFSINAPLHEMFDFAHPVNGSFAINEIAPSAFSKAILTGLVCSVSANLETSIMVRASLSSEYQAKHSSLSTWTNAISSLEALIADLNSEAVTNYSDSAKLKLLALDADQPTLSMVNASMDSFGAITYYQPSILDFVTGFNWAGRTNALAATIRTIGHREAVSAMYSVPVLYEDGAWKFIVSE